MSSKKLLIALIGMAIALLALCILCGLCFSGMLWYREQVTSLQSELSRLQTACIRI